MARLLSLLLALLFAFEVSLVVARPQSRQQRRSPTPIDISGLNTNAKRFARGLPPLPPLRKRKPTSVENARRAVPSQCAKSGVIQVLDAQSNAILGYVSQALKANQHYTLTDRNSAGTFSSTVFTSGTTSNINILDVNDGSHYLAGLIKKGEQLGDGNGDDKAAILGRSLSTNPGDPPQDNKDPSWNNRDTETAIWTYNSVGDTLTATWVNYANQTPSSTPVFFYWLHNGDKFYLTSSPSSPQNGSPVYLKYISAGDQCPNTPLR